MKLLGHRESNKCLLFTNGGFLFWKIVAPSKRKHLFCRTVSLSPAKQVLPFASLSSRKRETRSRRAAGNRTKYRFAIFFENPRFSILSDTGNRSRFPDPFRCSIPVSPPQNKTALAGLFCFSSGRRESNPVFTHPKRMYYRYTTARS